MRITIDMDTKRVVCAERDRERVLDLHTKEAFEVVSECGPRASWAVKYFYTSTQLGCPIIQFPQDMIAVQEIIWQVKPDVIIEAGIAHGGSVILYASVLELLGDGGQLFD